ncbi:MAG: mercuric reductase [Planctomycetota bacterium]
MNHHAQTPELQPLDEFNTQLAANVHPIDWTPPTPSGRYNLVVIGAGTAGLVTAAGAAGLGAKVALVESNLMGGDCLNVGCVPSKAILAAARVAANVRESAPMGIHADDPRVDFAAVMRRLRQRRSEISIHDSAKRFRDLGVDVFIGKGRFIGGDQVEVTADDGGIQTLRFKRAVIATGARATALPIPGIDAIKPLTNETLFSLTELPRRLTVIGGGPIGSEMAQAFARLGSEVTLIEKSSHILSREDSDAARIVQARMQRDGVRIQTHARVLRFEQLGSDKVTVFEQDGNEHSIAGDQVLLGIGRAPNIDGLGLEQVGVRADSRGGVQVNDRMQTDNAKIFAAGDVASKFQFTHAADYQARLVIGNTLFFGRKKDSNLVIPWCTYTSPELAHVGLLPDQAEAQGIPVDTFTQHFEGVDRAILDESTEGFARIHVRKGSDKIVGASIVAPHAGDLIAEVTLAMTHGLGLGKIAATIHPYPTTADAIRKLGDQYNKTRLTPRIATWMQRYLRWTR